MKNIILLVAFTAFSLLNTTATAQDTQLEPDQLNLPGDNLNLYAVMKLFQESPTLEEFEKKLNDESTKINNLDLNGDNQTDYIKVIDNIDGDTHNIALKVAVNQNEDQDVAVFVVKKDRNGQVIIQLIGDEDLYGKDYIIEPDSEAPTSTPNPGYSGDQPPPVDGATPEYQVSSWPVVQFIYVPTYSVWRSPWHWGAYPSYWRPWTPFFWHEYYGYHYHWNYYYHAHYRYTPVYRIPTWRERYYGGNFRSRSSFVETRARAGNYRQTYSRPDLANRGADLFKRDNPRAPHLNRPLPKFDNKNNNRPIVTRPSRPGNNNGDGRPGNISRPVTRPGNPNPGNAITPVTPSPGNNRPERPGTRPSKPAPGNGNTPGRPITRPVNPLPDNGNNNRPTRPVTRPVNPNPDNSNVPTRPVTRPVNPNPGNGNMHNRPLNPAAPQPASPRPVNNAPNRPVNRPAPAPRPQEQRQQPVNRPEGQRPARDHGGR